MEMAVASPVPGASESAQRATIPFQFTGTGAEYFRIWIVNLLLTVLTVGIYSAWAKVRRLRYFYGNTSLAGSAFEYHGQPIQILKGRLIALAALVVYSLVTRLVPITALLFVPLMLLALPWVIVRSRKFQMQVTSWRNIRFHFHGTYGQAAAAYIGYAILSTLTLNLMMPHLLHARVKFLLGQTSFGGERFEFNKEVGPYYRFYYTAVLFGLLGVIAFITVIIAMGSMLGVEGGLTGLSSSAAKAKFMPLLLGATALILYLPIYAFFETRFVNTTLDGVRIGPHTLRCKLELKGLLYIYVTNLLGMVCTLGLFYPWARIRRAQYQFDSMSVDTVGSLDTFVEEADAKTSATGEELGEFFDVDFGF
jgi:uncharacterized membrane protein YjgN (DUF898 family)